ncbi:unnamed protein product [Peniophora sp. CBMAI 1063]|nr:unnamed protein product [Peniophora sp. CBMAI 1063]
MKDQKRTDDFITTFCKELLERYPGADTLPGDTAFRQKIRNWFGNQGRLDRHPRKVLVTENDVDEEGKVLYKFKRSLGKEGSTFADDLKRISDMFSRKQRHVKYTDYLLANWQKGLKERADENWAMFSPLLPEGTDREAARKQFNHRFAAMELANQPAEVKKRLPLGSRDTPAESILEELSIEAQAHIQHLVQSSDFQQYLDTTCQALVNALHKRTGMSFTLLVGGCNIVENGEIRRNAYSTQHANGQHFVTSSRYAASKIDDYFLHFLKSDVYPAGIQKLHAFFPEAPPKSDGFNLRFAVLDVEDDSNPARFPVHFTGASVSQHEEEEVIKLDEDEKDSGDEEDQPRSELKNTPAPAFVHTSREQRVSGPQGSDHRQQRIHSPSLSPPSRHPLDDAKLEDARMNSAGLSQRGLERPGTGDEDGDVGRVIEGSASIAAGAGEVDTQPSMPTCPGPENHMVAESKHDTGAVGEAGMHGNDVPIEPTSEGSAVHSELGPNIGTQANPPAATKTPCLGVGVVSDDLAVADDALVARLSNISAEPTSSVASDEADGLGRALTYDGGAQDQLPAGLIAFVRNDEEEGAGRALAQDGRIQDEAAADAPNQACHEDVLDCEEAPAIHLQVGTGRPLGEDVSVTSPHIDSALSPSDCMVVSHISRGDVFPTPQLAVENMLTGIKRENATIFRCDYDGLRKMGDHFVWESSRSGIPDTVDARPSWFRLLDLWVAHEQRNNFDQGSSFRKFKLKIAQRPDGYLKWAKGRDFASVLPGSENVTAFSRAWLAWYKDLQPGWRSSDSWPFARPDTCTEISWEQLRKYGRHGVVQLLITLGWWGRSIKSDAIDELDKWVEVVMDMVWVMEQMAKTFPDLQELNNKAQSPTPAAEKKRKGVQLSETAPEPKKKYVTLPFANLRLADSGALYT